MKVWLDDERAAAGGWVHVRTPEEAIELLRGGEVEELSLDHDLVLGAGARERTGYDVSYPQCPWQRLPPVKAFPGTGLSVNTAKSSSASLTVPCKESSSKVKASGSSSLAWI